MYYECHVTMLGDKDKVKFIVENCNWKFSAIDGDITYGDGVKCYATMHYSSNRHTQEQVIAIVLDLAKTFVGLGVNVIRKKVELVVFDSKVDK